MYITYKHVFNIQIGKKNTNVSGQIWIRLLEQIQKASSLINRYLTLAVVEQMQIKVIKKYYLYLPYC